MHEILAELPAGARVLDLGSNAGSFDASNRAYKVVRVDTEPVAISNLVQADAAFLPFKDHSFAAIVSSHSLEHFEDYTGALTEMGRVVRRDGALYVRVPDATTVSDRIYKWLARGGGHVNAFRSAAGLAEEIETATGLRHVGTRTLCTSFCFLNCHNRRDRAPRRMLLLGGGSQTFLLLMTSSLRFLDRLLHTRTIVYGWALYFGNIQASINCSTWTNVCIRCGSAYSSEWLLDLRRVRRRFIFRIYVCPHCTTTNLFSEDKHYRFLDTL